MAKERSESPLDLVAELSRISTLRQAWRNVAANGGAAGIDRVSVERFEEELEANLGALAEEIRDGAYRALPVLRVRPRFLGASDRALVVPTVRDRVVQRAVADLLTPRVEPLLSPACRAFRKGHSAKSAADDVGRWVEEGTPWVLRSDVQGFYDHIRPERLLEMLAPLVDPAGLRFLERLVRCRIFDREQVSEMVVGIAQGSPLSPVLGNLYLAEVDRRMGERWRRYLRYCDDLIVLAGSAEEAEEARHCLATELEPLGLELHPEKTRVCRAEDGFVFLGYQFGPAGRGPAVKALEALAERLEELSVLDEPDLAAGDAVWRGWVAYFGPHPEPWLSTPAGLLARLRARTAKGADTDALVAARAALATRVGEPWARALAAAWRDQGWMEVAWMELATIAAGLRGQDALLARWAELLQIEPGALGDWLTGLSGPFKERLEGLEERLAQAGRYRLAQRLAALESAWEAPARAAEQTAGDGVAIEADDTGLDTLMDFFRGREGVYAVERVDRAGRRRFQAVQRDLEPDDWRAHLRGEVTLALPLVVAGNLAWLGVLDVDVERRALDRVLGDPSPLLGRALGASFRLRSELERRGAVPLLEASGRKGHHLWIRLAEPVAAGHLRRWLMDVVEAAGPLPEGVTVEAFPNRDRVREGELGPLMKLPLGVHSATGHRCALLDRRGEPLADPVEALRSLPRLAAEVVRSTVAEARRGAPEAISRVGPRARRMLEGCRVLAYLADKAERTFYLDHGERLALLCALGHLGEEGTEALHAIISHTYNYKRAVTERHARRCPPWPISCPKLRERHPEAVAREACHCPAKPRGRGYPTPVLLALKAQEIPVFVAKAAGVAAPPPAASSPTPAEEETSSAASAGRSTDGRASGPEGLGDGAVDPAAQARPQSSSTPRRKPAALPADPRRRAEVLVRRLAELETHRAGIQASITRAHGDLAKLFDEAGGDALELPSGTLRRVPDGEGFSVRPELRPP